MSEGRGNVGKPPEGGLRAWMELLRVSNVPTVWSNVLAGCGLGMGYGLSDPREFPWVLAGELAVAMSLIYVAGMAFNDVADAKVDAVERPGRPIPSGRVSKAGARAFVLVALAAALALVAAVEIRALTPASILVGCVLVYDRFHRLPGVSPGTVLLMGACRGMVYVTAAMAVAAQVNWALVGPAAGGMTVYVVAVSLLARREADPGMAPAMRQRRIGLVMVLLAGISVLDAVVLTLLRQPVPAVVAGGCFVLTRLGHRRVAGS